MATEGHNLSAYSLDHFKPLGFTIGIAVSEWNGDITENLLLGALEVLKSVGISDKHIIIHKVPGAFELPLASKWLFNQGVDGVIAIGNVIQGETKHFDFVCQGTTQGLMSVMLEVGKPIAFCLLTDENKQQSIDRSGGKHGNKGIECAVALLKMLELESNIK